MNVIIALLKDSVQSLSRVWLFVIPWIAAHRVSLSIAHSQSSLKLMSVKSVVPSIHLLSPSPPAPNPSQNQSLFQWVNSSHEVAKVLEFSFSIIPFKEIPRLTSFRMDWLDLLAVQGTLKSLLQHYHSSINSSMLSFLYSPALTSIHDHWKNHSLD